MPAVHLVLFAVVALLISAVVLARLTIRDYRARAAAGPRGLRPLRVLEEDTEPLDDAEPSAARPRWTIGHLMGLVAAGAVFSALITGRGFGLLLVAPVLIWAGFAWEFRDEAARACRWARRRLGRAASREGAGPSNGGEPIRPPARLTHTSPEES